MEDRRVVAERLAGRRRRDHHDVAAGQRVVDRLRLMGVELGDAARDQGAAQPAVEGFGKRSKLRRHRRKTPQCGDVQVRRIGPFRDLAGRQTLQRLVEGAVTP